MCKTSFPPSLRFISVDADEIKRLGKRFKKLDLDNSGSLSVEEFMSLPELQQNPLVQRVIDIFDTDGNGEVDFQGRLISSPPHLCPLTFEVCSWEGFLHLFTVQSQN